MSLKNRFKEFRREKKSRYQNIEEEPVHISDQEEPSGSGSLDILVGVTIALSSPDIPAGIYM